MDLMGTEMGAWLASAPGLGGGTPTTGAPGGAGAAGGGAAGGGAQPANPFGGGMIFMVMGLFVFMILMSTMSSRKEKKKRAAMLDSLGKHDRIVTTGGMIGTVVEIKSDEVVLKVDESTNTRIHFNRAAVANVLKHANKSSGDSEGEAEQDVDLKETLQPAEQLS